MSTQRKDHLFELVSSLSKSEKRNFKLYARRINLDGNVLFLDIFQFLEKQSTFDVNTMLASLPHIEKKQVPNLKRSLYNHILASLALLYDQTQAPLKIRSFITYAELLYQKGLYLQSLKLLMRAKKIATKNFENSLLLQIVNLEQKIQSRHITRSTKQRMSDLKAEAERGLQVHVNISKLSNLKLYLQRLFIIHGSRIEGEILENLDHHFAENIRPFSQVSLNSFEKIYYYQAFYWFHYLKQEYDKCFKCIDAWQKVYLLEPGLRAWDFDLFLICNHLYSNMAFFTGNADACFRTFQFFEPYIKDSKLSYNALVLSNLFHLQSQSNFYFLTRKYEEGLYLVPKIKSILDQYDKFLDQYKIMILYYKMACLLFGARRYSDALTSLKEIDNASNPLRDEIVCYSKLLSIMSYIELKEEDLANYELERAVRYIRKARQKSPLMELAIDYFLDLLRTELYGRRAVHSKYYERLCMLKQKKIRSRSFTFLNLDYWSKQHIS